MNASKLITECFYLNKMSFALLFISLLSVGIMLCGCSPPVAVSMAETTCGVFNESNEILENVQATFIESHLFGDIKKQYFIGTLGPRQCKTLQVDKWCVAEDRKIAISCSGYLWDARFAGFVRGKLSTRPLPDEWYIGWLDGQTIMAEKGIFSNDMWTVRQKEVSKFTVINVTAVPNDAACTAEISFTAQNSGKGIQVKGNIRYKLSSDHNNTEFIDFIAEGVKKIGNW